jgi:hypothetical protein
VVRAADAKARRRARARDLATARLWKGRRWLGKRRGFAVLGPRVYVAAVHGCGGEAYLGKGAASGEGQKRQALASRHAASPRHTSTRGRRGFLLCCWLSRRGVGRHQLPRLPSRRCRVSWRCSGRRHWHPRRRLHLHWRRLPRLRLQDPRCRLAGAGRARRHRRRKRKAAPFGTEDGARCRCPPPLAGRLLLLPDRCLRGLLRRSALPRRRKGTP